MVVTCFGDDFAATAYVQLRYSAISNAALLTMVTAAACRSERQPAALPPADHLPATPGDRYEGVTSSNPIGVVVVLSYSGVSRRLFQPFILQIRFCSTRFCSAAGLNLRESETHRSPCRCLNERNKIVVRQYPCA